MAHGPQPEREPRKRRFIASPTNPEPRAAIERGSNMHFLGWAGSCEEGRSRAVGARRTDGIERRPDGLLGRVGVFFLSGQPTPSCGWLRFRVWAFCLTGSP